MREVTGCCLLFPGSVGFRLQSGMRSVRLSNQWGSGVQASQCQGQPFRGDSEVPPPGRSEGGSGAAGGCLGGGGGQGGHGGRA